jgi:crotonobetainyl-CoA:carnitine CoA-transferase CaiB-like acyl-CoA transferase
MVLREDGLTQFAPPLKLSDHEFTIHQAAPQAGEHSAEILRAAGYSDAQIDCLQATGVLG